jgi:hypothetical protein
MSIERRLKTLEDILAPIGCKLCESRDAAAEDKPIETQLAAFFADCPRCHRQRTWMDLVAEATNE